MRTATRTLWGLFACITLLTPCPARAQGMVVRPNAPSSATARREANLIRVNGAPTLLLWADGLENPADITRYAELGFNTAYVRVRNDSQQEIARASALAQAAESRGLLVVLSLAPRALNGSQGTALAIDAGSDAYAEAVEDFVAAVVGGLGQHPRLIAWAVEGVRPENLVVDDASFVRSLRDWYPSLAALNSSWGSEFATWDAISLSAARDIDSAYPYGLGRASLDYSYHRESAYSDAMALWADAVRRADPGRLVFAAAVRDYRSIISLPPVFDGVLLGTTPSVAEADWDTQNVHAVDIARRGNQFAAVQTLEIDRETNGAIALQWAAFALARGATGIALSSWDALQGSESLGMFVGDLVEMAAAQAFPNRPMAQVAVLYEPFAGGSMNNGRSLYGFLDGTAPNTPTALFALSRGGTRYGILDVLRWDSLDEVDLSQYGTIIAPMAFYLPEDVQLTLQNYVLRGGALIVDAGVGMYQADGVTTSMPPIMREILGMRYLDLEAFGSSADFRPTVEVGEVFDPARPTETRVLAPGQEGKEVDPALTRFAQQLEMFITRADVAQYLGDDIAGAAANGLRVKGLGKGFAAYSPDFLYETWDSADPSFDEFHDRVLAHGSDIEVVDPNATWPGVVTTLLSDGAVAAASPAALPISVLIYGVGNRIFLVPSGAMRLDAAVDVDRVELLFPGRPLARAQPLPLYIWPQREGSVASVSVVRYDRQGIELLVHGTGATAFVRDGTIGLNGGDQTLIRLEVRGGLYPIRSDSTHTVTVRQGLATQLAKQYDVMPNTETGSLVIEEMVSSARIIIEPSKD